MAINSKQKGSEYERKIAKILGNWWGETFHRVPMSGGLHWQSDNRIVGDIVPPPGSTFPFSVECKKREEWCMEKLLKGKAEIDDYWKQCTRDAEGVNLKPFVVFARNFSQNYVMIDFTDWILLGNPDIPHFIIDNKNYEPRVICILEELIGSVPKSKIEESFSKQVSLS